MESAYPSTKWQIQLRKLSTSQQISVNIGYIYRPQRSCGQGNVFTGVCLSIGGEGVCLSAFWDVIPPGTRQTPSFLPRNQADPPGPGRHPPRDQADTPPIRQTPPPPGKQTPAYGLRTAGTHPTGMHSC